MLGAKATLPELIFTLYLFLAVATANPHTAGVFLARLRIFRDVQRPSYAPSLVILASGEYKSDVVHTRVD